MKKLIKKIVLFFLPLMVFGVILMSISIDKRLRYEYVKNDCFGHGIWIHDRIFGNKQPIDIAFVGSSRTLNSINDSLIENRLSEQFSSVHVASFGYCRLGRNLDYVLIKDLLKAKSPKIVVMEVRDDEDRYSHDMFPFLADEEDIFAPPLFFNRDIFTDYYQAVFCKLQLIKDRLYEHKSEALRMENHVYKGLMDTAVEEKLNKAKQERLIKAKEKLGEFATYFYMKYPHSYLEKIYDLCRTKNTPLYFLYLPSYGSHENKPDSYQAAGKMLFPPVEIYNDKANWFDDAHLNRTGAEKISQWVSVQISIEYKKILK